MARPSTHKLSGQVAGHSNALNLKQGVFKLENPKRIAAWLKDSAEHSESRKSDPYRSAMAKLTSYINRAGTQLQPDEKSKLEKAKDELRTLYNRPATGRTTAQGRRVERPGTGKQAGPSGQKDKGQQDRKHANK